MIGYYLKQIKVAVWHFLFWHWRALLAWSLAVILVLALLAGTVLGLYELLREKVEVRDGLTQNSNISLQDITVEGSTLHYTLVNKGKSRYRTSATLPILQKKVEGEWVMATAIPTGPVKSDFEEKHILIEPKSTLTLSQSFAHVQLDAGEYRLVYDGCKRYDPERQNVYHETRIYVVGYFTLPATE